MISVMKKIIFVFSDENINNFSFVDFRQLNGDQKYGK
jgi:hypothetical protein